MSANQAAAAQRLAEITKLINSKLPSGICAVINKTGNISYQVRTSKTVFGVVNRVTVGTFDSSEAAVRALIEYKVTGTLLSINKVMKEHQQELLQAVAEHSRAVSADAVEQAEQQMQSIVDSAEEHLHVVERKHINVFKFLETVPFHELDPERNYNYTDESGESKTIPKDVVAKFFVWMESGTADAERSDSGTSAAAQSDQ